MTRLAVSIQDSWALHVYALNSFDILFGKMYPLGGVGFMETTLKKNSRKSYLTDCLIVNSFIKTTLYEENTIMARDIRLGHKFPTHMETVNATSLVSPL
jgi:hypothetical protein